MFKKHLLTVAVAVVAIFVVLASDSRNHAQVKPDAKATAVEFKVVKFSASQTEKGLTKQLNDLAQNGWQRAFVIATESHVTGNKRSDKFNRFTRTYTYVAYRRPATHPRQAE